MNYTVNLKKILSEKQFAFMQSISSSARAVMSPELFNHCIGTLNYCFIMADRFLLKGSGSSTGGKSQEKSIPVRYFNLAVAAILHDYAKILSFEELKAIAIKEKLRISDFELDCQPILHSFLAPFLLERDFKIKDRDILNSVRMHTTGSVKMSVNDKILYISDKIEETRNYEGVEKLRHLSLKDINLCLLEVYKSNIIYVIKGNNVLHPETAKIWNYIHGGLRNVT